MPTLERFDPEQETQSGINYFNRYANFILPICKGKVLDIGCGLGFLSRKIAQLPEVEHVIGTDKIAERKDLHKNIEFWSMKTEELVFANGPHQQQVFDTIVSTEHIEHLPEELHVNLLEWIKTHMKDDNSVFLGSMPNVWEHSKNPYHLKEYSYESWLRLLNFYFSRITIQIDSQLMVWEAKK